MTLPAIAYMCNQCSWISVRQARRLELAAASFQLFIYLHGRGLRCNWTRPAPYTTWPRRPPTAWCWTPPRYGPAYIAQNVLLHICHPRFLSYMPSRDD